MATVFHGNLAAYHAADDCAVPPFFLITLPSATCFFRSSAIFRLFSLL